jgi:hypothetical protein
VKAVSIRCPNCNAALEVDDGQTTVTCAYCHASSRLQAHTQVWQAAAPGPRNPGTAAPARNAAMVLVIGMLVLVVGGAGAAYFMVRRASVPFASSGGATTAPTPSSQTSKRAPEQVRWNSDRPLLRDLDGDGADDLVGVISVYDGEPKNYVAAYSGDDGHPMWRSAEVPKDAGSQPHIAMAGDWLLLSGTDGKLRSYAVGDGKTGWTVELGEKLAMLCALPAESPPQVRVITADDRGRDVQLATGKTTEVQGKSRRQLRSCEELPTDDDNLYGMTQYDPFRDRLPELRWMSVRHMVRRDNLKFYAGGKSPGTEVPMVALFDGRNERWRAELPSSDPLTSLLEDKCLYFDGRVALGCYSTNRGAEGQTRLVALRSNTGERMWEAALTAPGGSMVLTSALTTQHRALAVAWGVVVAFDLHTGKRAFVIGD